MNSLSHTYLERIAIPSRLVGVIEGLGAARAREEDHRTKMPERLETLRTAALIESAESSNRIEGVTAPPKRLLALMRGTEPETRSEAEIAGYRNVLKTIHENWKDIPFTPSVVRQLHRDLFQYVGGGGEWKHADNDIREKLPDGTERVRARTVAAWQTPTAMDELHRRLEEAQAAHFPALLLTPAYILDFLCIHPFKDGNGRMARLLSLLLLYQNGYGVGRWISLERIVEDNKDRYYETLHLSDQGWHEGQHNLIPWLDYFLSVVLGTAYRELDQRVHLLVTGRGGKSAMVLDAIRRQRGTFTKADLVELCPGVSAELIRKVMAEEQDAGRLECLAKGPKAPWIRVFRTP